MNLHSSSPTVLLGVSLDSPADIIDNTREISTTIDNSISVLWDFLTSPLFIQISNVGAIIAALGVGFYAIKWIKDLAKSEVFFLSDKMTQIVAGFMLAVLLGTPTARGKLLADLLVGYDAVSTNLSNMVLVAARPDPQKDPILSAQVRQAVVDRAIQDFQQCEKFPFLAQERSDCAGEGIQRVQKSLSNYRQNEWAQDTELELILMFGSLSPGATGEQVKARLRTAGQSLKDLVNSGLNKALTGFTFVITVAWLLLLRIAKPLLSIVFPLYIGLSYVPSSKPPVLWAIGMLIDVVLVEIIFKIFLSMIAELALTLPLTVSSLVLGLVLTLGGIPASWVLGRRLSDGLTGVGLSAFPGLGKK